MKIFKKKIKEKIPLQIKQYLVNLNSVRKKFEFQKEVKTIRQNQLNIVRELKDKKILRVIFLVIHDSIWKYEEVYKLLDNDARFNPQIVIIPLVREGKAVMEVYNNSVAYFNKNNYNTFLSLDSKENIWLDIKELTQPDIVFFTNPHKLTFNKYYIDNFLDKLTCYVPYAFVVIHSINMHYNKKFHHFLWKYFVETEHHKEFCHKFQISKASNAYISGFPGLDRIYSNEYKPKKVWKKFGNESSKKIIWAPHHTISGQGNDLDYSSFMEYHNYFIKLVETRNDLQIAFKPHPFLKEKLYKDKGWGVDKTNKYYDKWDTLPNAQFEDGEYVDLFQLSDALITDSASFIVEYLYFDKPILFTLNDDSVIDRFNSFGKLVFDYLYTADSKNKVIQFIQNQVFHSDDGLKVDRNFFLCNKILPRNEKTASENIFNELKKELTK